MNDSNAETSEVKVIETTNGSRWNFLRKLPGRSTEASIPTNPELRTRNKLIDTILTQGLLSSTTLKEQQRDFLSSIEVPDYETPIKKF